MYDDAELKIHCDDCNAEVIEFFEPRYNGKRGRCSNCEKDFPLE